jgi:carbamate kinase
MADYGTPTQREIHRSTPGAMRDLGFAAGSMGPKVDAACRFVELTGDMAAIGRLEDAMAIIDGTAGTVITPGGNYGGPDDIRPPVPQPPETRVRRA